MMPGISHHVLTNTFATFNQPSIIKGQIITYSTAEFFLIFSKGTLFSIKFGKKRKLCFWKNRRRMTWNNIILLGLLLLSASLLGTQGNRDDDHTMHEEKTKEKLEILTNEVAELKKDVQELKKEFKHSNYGPDTNHTNETGTEGIEIVSVSRRSLSEGMNGFTIRYKSSTLSRRVVVLCYANESVLKETISNEIPALPPGVAEWKTETKAENGSVMTCYVGDNTCRVIRLFLRNEPGDDLTETEIALPVLEMIDPKGGDIVYEPGHNVTFKLTYPPKPDEEEQRPIGGFSHRIPEEVFLAQYRFVKPGDDQLITRSTDSSMFDLVKKKKSLDRLEVEVKINTAVARYSGVIICNSGLNRWTDHLVMRVEVIKQFVLRPSTQLEPFPKGKLYAERMYGYDDHIDDNGDSQSYCSYGKTCSQYCSIDGNDIQSLRVIKTVNGKSTPLNVSSNPSVIRYHKDAFFEVTPKEGGLSPVAYECVASNAEGSQVVVRRVVHFGQDVVILRNESSMKKADDGHSTSVVCTAYGVPLPVIDIECGTVAPTGIAILYQSDDVISVTGTCPDVPDWPVIGCNAKNDFRSDFHYLDEDGHSNYTMPDYVYENFVMRK